MPQIKQRGPTKRNLLKCFFITKLLNNPLASCSLINLNFLLSHTAHFDKSIILPFFVFTTFRFLFSVFFLHFKQYDNSVFYKWTKIFDKVIQPLNFWFLLSDHLILLAHYLLKRIHINNIWIDESLKKTSILFKLDFANDSKIYLVIVEVKATNCSI